MRATIVLVIYKQDLTDSESFRSLRENWHLLDVQDLELILHDNSPTPQPLPLIDATLPVRYHHDPSNPGLATAYNLALRSASQRGSDWLLLLDQDTQLSARYFQELLRVTQALPPECACVVPLVTDGRHQISPVDCSGIRAHAQGIHPGCSNTAITAINSGACWRVSWLEASGGFNPEFPLDYLDHWAFQHARDQGQQLYVMESEVRQNLSISARNQVSKSRYESIFESEYRFYSRYRTDLFTSYRRHLPFRLLKQLLLFRDKSIALLTLKLMFRKPD
ncbi:glycosyltransferase [Pseudomonas nitroreducens]|uniref:glycosyltransferase n=1 Tax=Pseudomonas nitroreducens TaxID=46680 RepID=UPI002F350ABE